MASSVSAEPLTVPLCVDLDGTVIRTDMLWESFVRLIRRNPIYLFLAAFWFLRGRAHLKMQIARRADVDVTTLPFCPELLAFLKDQQKAGRRLLLVTASNDKLAQKVGKHLGLFEAVLASDGQTNLRGKAKGATLAAKFGERGFDYAGNCSVDYAVWKRSRQALVVNASPRIERGARQCATIGGTFDCRKPSLGAWVSALRPHQWLKNLIVFIPLLAAHKLGELPLLTQTVQAFIAFALCASGVYILNDLLDLDADRGHPTKAKRPFASGALPLSYGLIAVPVLIGAGIVLASRLGSGFAAVIVSYLVLTSLYSWFLKQWPLVDVFCLAALYTLRLVGGHEATSVKYSAWLLVFSMFIFLSLALLKRYVEVSDQRGRNKTEVLGRGYVSSDLQLIAMIGICTGCLAALVLALYTNSQDVLILYTRPTVLIGVCPLLLFWISRAWMLAHRGLVHEDPVLFALRDPVSYATGILTLLVMRFAAG